MTRTGFVLISPPALADLLAGRAVIETGWPADAVIRSMRIDHDTERLVLKCDSQEFTPVYEGAPIPHYPVVLKKG